MTKNLKKWATNLALLLFLLLATTMLCGFNGTYTDCGSMSGNVVYYNHSFGIGDFGHPAYESTLDSAQLLTVYIPLDTAVQIPIKAVITPTDDIVDPISPAMFSIALSEGSSLPDGVTFQASAFSSNADGSMIGSAVISVPAQASATELPAFDVALVSTFVPTPTDPSVTPPDPVPSNNWFSVVICATQTNCDLCSGTIQQDGAIEHLLCDVCGVGCDGSDYTHLPCTLDSDKTAAHHSMDAEWTKTATQHSKAYACCDTVVVATADHTWADEVCTVCDYVCSHAGGIATCRDKAICNTCHQTLQPRNPHSRSPQGTYSYPLQC